MKVLFIGGTGNISSRVSSLAVNKGIDLYLLNRGQRSASVPGAKSLVGDINNEEEIESLLKAHEWDVVVNWIAFSDQDVARDYRLFRGRAAQYIFISSATVYQKPPASPIITESTPLENPFWQYARNKIACENLLNSYYKERQFPVTIVRPSLTYDTVIPVPIGGWNEFTVADRIIKGKKVIVHGDGTSLFTITHADDFAKGFIGLVGHRQAIGESFHITSDEVLTWDQIYRALADALGSSANIIHIHIPSEILAKFSENLRGSLMGDKAVSVIFDNTKIKKFVPEFKATIPFKEGIRQTMDWFKADPSRMVINEETNSWIDRVIGKFESVFGSY